MKNYYKIKRTDVLKNLKNRLINYLLPKIGYNKTFSNNYDNIIYYKYNFKNPRCVFMVTTERTQFHGFEIPETSLEENKYFLSKESAIEFINKRILAFKESEVLRLESAIDLKIYRFLIDGKKAKLKEYCYNQYCEYMLLTYNFTRSPPRKMFKEIKNDYKIKKWKF